MKALLIADDEKAINNISEVLKSAGYDTIVYKWFLKALDNIEEIAPHLIVVSTSDYPRHWKIIAQYATKGFGDYRPQLILYTDENFDEEEMKKAQALNVRGWFDSIGVDGLDKLREILSKTDDIFSGQLKEQTIARLEEVREDETAKIKKEPAETARASQENAEKKDNEDKVLTVQEILESFSGQASPTPLPGVEALKQLLEENDFTPRQRDDIILNNEELSDENTKYGENDMSDEKSIEDKLAEIMSANKAAAKEKAQALRINDMKENAVSFVFTNPVTLAMVSGIARNYNGLVLEFTPDVPSFIMNLSPGTKIGIASMKVNDKIENVFAEVMSNDAKKLALAIKKIS